MGEAHCERCQSFDRFTPRADEPSGFGCHANGWEGYVLDPARPPCGGVRFVPATRKDTDGGSHGK